MPQTTAVQDTAPVERAATPDEHLALDAALAGVGSSDPSEFDSPYATIRALAAALRSDLRWIAQRLDALSRIAAPGSGGTRGAAVDSGRSSTAVARNLISVRRHLAART